jgi:hypothetical protein
MTEPSSVPSAGSYDAFLTERLEALRQKNPSPPPPYLRMQLIQALHQEHAFPPKEAMRIVDEFYNARGLGIRQPSPLQAVLFAVLISPVLVIPILLVHWLWLQFRPR